MLENSTSVFDHLNESSRPGDDTVSARLVAVNEHLRSRIRELESELEIVRLKEKQLNNDLNDLHKKLNETRQKDIPLSPQAIVNSAIVNPKDQRLMDSISPTGSESSGTSNFFGRHITWNEYFMAVAQLAARRSKDPSTQVGACIVNAQNKIVATGYNGMPNGVHDKQVPWTKEGPYLDTKYAYVVHAELNAILNSTMTDLRGCRVYVSLFPCNECAKAIIQSGIKHVIYMSDKHADKDSTKAAKIMFSMSDILTERYSCLAN